MSDQFDLLILGAGAAGMPAAIFAAKAGARVLVVEAGDRTGGSFHLSSGVVAAAGTRVQAEKGISDTPQRHYDDIMRISGGTADPALVDLAVRNGADTFHWLMDCGFRCLPEHPVTPFFHEPYSVPRMYWAAEGGKAVYDAIDPAYREAEEKGLIITWLNSRLDRLVLDPSGAVTGAVIDRDGAGLQSVGATSTLLATGGYTGNAQLFAQLSGKPLWGGGLQLNKGKGLEAAVEAGSEIINTDKFLPGFGVEAPEANGGFKNGSILIPQDRQPWELFVDKTGARFMREDDPSVDYRERALRALPDMSFWVVYDGAIRDAAPPLLTDPDDVLARRFATLDSYAMADTLPQLAGLTGMDVDVLESSVAAYNRAIADGAPDPMDREHRPAPIGTGPFFAVRHFGWSITSFAGIKVGPDLRVLRADGTPIENLYAAGEIIGLGSTSGAAFTGGMSVTPAMTFGRLLGTRLAALAHA